MRLPCLTWSRPIAPSWRISTLIFLLDTTQIGESHAPFTRAFTRLVGLAFPDQELVLRARASHLQVAFAQPDPVLTRRLSLEPIAEDAPTSIAASISLLLDVRRRAGRGCHLVIFLTGRPADIWAAKLMRRVDPGLRCHLVMHGDVNSITKPRSRHPLRRLGDYRGSIGYARHPDVRLIALEAHVRASIEAVLPAAAGQIDVLPHPCVPTDAPWHLRQRPGAPLRFGLIGIAGRSKGLDVFARVARRVVDAVGAAVDFRVVGKFQPGWQALDLEAISGPRPFAETWLPAEVFEREVAALDYIILPYDMRYYAFAASGVMLDVLRTRTPVICFHNPAIADVAARHGDIGHVCADEDEIVAVVMSLVTAVDPSRYRAQQMNLDAAYRDRLPDALATAYHDLVQGLWEVEPLAPAGR